MKKLASVAAALLLSTPFLASCASAQNGPPPPQGWGQQRGWGHPGQQGGPGWDGNAFWRGAPDSPRDRIQFLKDRVNRGIGDGSIDRREANRVNHELDDTSRWIKRMHWEDAGRLSPGQNSQVQQRLDSISRQIHWMRRSGW